MHERTHGPTGITLCLPGSVPFVHVFFKLQLPYHPCRQKRCRVCHKVFHVCLEHSQTETCSDVCRAEAHAASRKAAQARYRGQKRVKQHRMLVARRKRRNRQVFLKEIFIGSPSMGHHDSQKPLVPVKELPSEPQELSMPESGNAERSFSHAPIPVEPLPKNAVRCAFCGKVFLAWIVQGRWRPRLRYRWQRRKERYP